MGKKLTRIKICCITSIEEAKLAIDAGADALGLVSEMPSGPGVISEIKIAEIVKIVPPSVSTFLLTSKQDVDEIIKQHHHCRTNTIQLCDRIINGSYNDLKNSLHGIKIVQVIHVSGKESIEEANTISNDVDAMLLDSGNQKLKIKKLGGTGKTHNWSISKKIVAGSKIPVFLAGGLNPDNVKEAIRQVKPFGVDVCSGVRSDGKLDKTKLKKFIANVNSIYK